MLAPQKPAAAMDGGGNGGGGGGEGGGGFGDAKEELGVDADEPVRSPPSLPPSHLAVVAIALRGLASQVGGAPCLPASLPPFLFVLLPLSRIQPLAVT